MAFKLILNVLYTIGLVLCAFVAYQYFMAKNYPVMAAAIAVGLVVIFLKIRLLKDVKNSQKKV
ncbi:DUF6358 family protein [Mucilaginibacter ginsenosidivorax]|uniref:Uncharacterized protein n=1 Tax=Mucilaginibacter ginsenosidivorax TaxID=862126 RepID=A0A5B8VZX1_9SPHI|nr:DUF6358 family protein [Mucilaginibacter ginsenosidivorax]QEC77089.1 hypothetical protein FSB76_14465 [Mucilaginibacter ginsenosidivorax]